MTTVRRGTLFVLLALVFANADAVRLADYDHTVWTATDGIDGVVAVVRRTPNGMLRISSEAGTLVFDGVKFQRVEVGKPFPYVDEEGSVGQADPTGAIYFTDTRTGKFLRAANGAKQEVAGAPAIRARPILFTPDGDGWFAGTSGLYRVRGARIDAVNERYGLSSDTKIEDLATDRHGTVWLTTGDQGLTYLAKGADRFVRHEPGDCANLAVAPDDSIFCSSMKGLLRVTVVDGRPVKTTVISTQSYRLLMFDSRGGFWIQSMSGLQHLSDWRALLQPDGIARLERDAMTTKDGLSSEVMWWLTEDADGDVWIGTGAGLERFHPPRFERLELPAGRSLAYGMAFDATSDLFTGNWTGPLMRIRGTSIESIPTPEGVATIRAIGDTVWVSSESELWTFVATRAPEKIGGLDLSAFPPIHDIAQADDGAVWLQAGRRLLKRVDGRWSKPEGDDAPPSDRGYTLFSDAQRRLWFAGSKVYVLEQGKLRQLDSDAYAATVGTGLTAFVKGERRWIGGTKGVGAFVGDAFRPVRLRGDDARLVTGIVETDDGELWLRASSKVLRLNAEQVRGALAGEPVDPDVFDSRDGLRGTTSIAEPRPSLIPTPDGKLLASTNKGLFSFDPHGPREASRPPVVLIGAVKHDNESLSPASDVSLAPNPRRIEIAYTAPVMHKADRVAFRYRLVGLENDWQNVGVRRSAIYTELAPGRYRFEVEASDEQGRWPGAASTMRLTVLPAWYQTVWFRCVVAIVVLVLLWTAYVARVRVLRARDRAQLDAIVSERERIARDLHDTLLQDVQGMILALQSTAAALPPASEARATLDAQLDRADRLLGDARDHLVDLRAGDDQHLDLRDAFELIETERPGATRVKVVEDGSPRAMPPRVRELIYRIGREAILNGLAHGGAKTIEVRLDFEDDRFVLGVADDGVGIPSDVLEAGGRRRHYGLKGMRERAAQLGASLSIESPNDGGTRVRLELPADRAYGRPHRSTLRDRLARWIAGRADDRDAGFTPRR